MVRNQEVEQMQQVRSRNPMSKRFVEKKCQKDDQKPGKKKPAHVSVRWSREDTRG
jgi:hypothetical protein